MTSPRTGNICEAFKDCLETGDVWVRVDLDAREIRKVETGYWSVFESGYARELTYDDVRARWRCVDPWAGLDIEQLKKRKLEREVCKMVANAAFHKNATMELEAIKEKFIEMGFGGD